MNKIKCLIIDDEAPAVALLEQYASMIDQIEVLATENSAIKAFEFVQSMEVDLIFLDIQMPVLSGLDFIKTLKNPPSIILTTAYREYAYEGYDLDVIDYLLKPITFDRFLRSVDRYRSRTDSGIQTDEFKGIKAPKFVYFNVNKTKHKIALSDIIYLESLKDYTRIHTSDSNLVVKGNIGTSLKLLPQEHFLRIHRSFAIALAHVQSYNQSEVEVQGVKLPIGMSYREEVVNRVGE